MSEDFGALTGNPVFFRTYSRLTGHGRESWEEMCKRSVDGLAKLGKFTPEEIELVARMQKSIKALPSGRWLWVGGTEWLDKPQNYSGAYNCTSTNLNNWNAFAFMMDLAMMGCGTGAVIEPKYYQQLPTIKNRIDIEIIDKIGETPPSKRLDETVTVFCQDSFTIKVGDSRQGWVEAYKQLLQVASDDTFDGVVVVKVSLANVRPAGEKLKQFGGVANPVKLENLFYRCANILNKAHGRKLTSLECCLLIDEAASTIVAGNIRRCLPGDALVHTESGLVPIAKIRIGDRVLTSKGFYPVTNFFDQGEQSLCRIKTQDGSFECTAEHKIAVLTDVYGNYKMVKAKDLKQGDRLIFVPKQIPGTATELPEFCGKITAKTKPITIPALTASTAYFIGYLHGNGSVSSDGSRVRFAIPEDSSEILDYLIDVGKEFGLNTYTVATPEQRKAKAYELQFNSTALNQYLKCIKQAFQPLNIPDCILLGKPNIREAYLSGLADADGCHSQNVLVTSVQEHFLRQVQALYASLGITTRSCSSIRKNTKKWEGELVTVGETAYNSVRDIFTKYSLQYLKQKQQTPKSFKDHGFPKAMVRPIVNTYQYGWSNNQEQMIVSTLKKYVSEATELIPVKFVDIEFDVRTAPTYDIEVATVHEFVCEGILVSNSAGMRQFTSSDNVAANAKANLWEQTPTGEWRIDPEKDALRMANHTRVFHQKPTYEEVFDSVTSQYWSGEGAIQWAGEAVARANADLLITQKLKAKFLNAYENGGVKEWIRKNYPGMPHAEIEHRVSTYGLNPCVTADTWIHTEKGARQVKDLIGKQTSVYVDGELFSTTPEGFWLTGIKPVLKVITQEGYELRLTDNHQLLKVTAQTQRKQYSEWTEAKDLSPGHYISVHNHREAQHWDSFGTFDEGWLIGNLIGNGSISSTQWGKTALLRYWEDSQEEMGRHAVALLKKTVDYAGTTESGHYYEKQNYRVVQSTGLARLAANYDVTLDNKMPTGKIEEASYEFYRGFLRGLFDADGSVQGNQQKGISVRLSQSNLETLKIVQRMLARLGIISTIYQKAQHELVISNDNVCVFQDIIGFQKFDKANRLNELITRYEPKLNRERFVVKIKEIIPDGVEAVFDCTVPGVSRFDGNGIVAHNCGEIIGSNFHCVSGDTLLITKDGLHAIKDVVGCDVEIWNGRNWSQVQPFKTGSSRVLYRVRFADGTYLDATEYHRFFVKDRFGKEYKEVQTKDLMDASKYRIHTKPFTIQYDDGLDIDTNYAYSLGVAVGDGTTDKDNNAKIRLYGKKIALSVAGDKSPIREYEYVTNFTDVTNLSFSGEFLKSLKTKPEALNIIASWNREAILHFIAGLADTDGTNSSGNGIRIYISDYDRAYRIQLLLIKCGIRSSVNLCAYKGAVTNYGVRSKDLYSVQVTDCGKIPCQRLDVSQGRVPKCKGKWQVIRSVEQLPGLHDTYCFNEPQYHEGVFGNTLTGNCNLSEIHLNQLNPTDYKEQEDAFRAASLSVAALLHHRFTEPIYQESRELDPIVGVSFTGLFDFFVHAFGAEWLHWWQQEREDNEQGRIFKQKEQEYLSRWKDIVHQTVWEYCDKHNLKRPNRCTTVQPSGCLDRTALRIFDQGLLYADELIAPGSGEATNLKLSVREGVSVTTGIANQPLQLIKVTLNNGRVLRMTPNHRLSIDGNWIYASDMTPGMKIDFSLGEYQNSQETSLLDIDQFSYTREAKQLESGHNRGGITATIIKTPKIMSPDLAYFIGALFGNGCLSATGHRIRFSSNSYKLLERLQQIAQNLFVLNGRINKYSGREAYELSISSVQLYDWLQLNGIAKTEKSLNLDRIPLAIRCSSKQSILSFFCGLIDTDGCIRVNGSMSIDSASEEFIRNLQQIGEAVGLCFSIFHNTEGENNQTQKNMWGLCLSRMLSKPDALDYLNENSQKAEIRPIPSLKRSYKFDPYLIESVVWEETPDYSYDFAVQGEDDNDSWYWQGAIKSHNTKSLLTGASPGWHPPKAQQFIRRITFRKNDPVALACIDFGYNVVPSQSDKDENGNLLDNPFDERCTEWLVEIPVAVSWANLPGVDVDISKFSVLAQFDFYMQVQKYYTTHNTSATLELRQNEIGALSRAIYDSIKNNDGYISAAILSRFDDFQSYPRLPFEPISKDKYLQLVEEVNQRRTNDSFLDALHKYDNGFDEQSGPAPCDSDKCLLPELK